MATQIHASIVIVNWNTEQLLDLCIASIYRHLSSIEHYQIIVVDNFSSDGSVKMVEQNYPGVELIKNTDNAGFGAAVNQAQVLCKGEYILQLNSDAQLLDDGVASLIDIMNEDTEIGVITGLMQDEYDIATPSYFSFPKYAQLIKSFSFDLIKKIGSGNRGKDRGASKTVTGFDVLDVDWVSGGYMLIRKTALAGQPIFDKRLFMYFEDTLLCSRMWSQGHRVTFSPIAPILHAAGGSGKKIKTKTTGFSFESSRIYISEVYGGTALRFYNITLCFLWVVFSLLFGLLSLLGVEKGRIKAELFKYLLRNFCK